MVELPEQMEADPLITPDEDPETPTVIVADPLFPEPRHELASVTETMLYVLVEVGETEILLLLV